MTGDELRKAYELSEKRQELIAQLHVAESANHIELRTSQPAANGQRAVQLAKPNDPDLHSSRVFEAIVRFLADEIRRSVSTVTADLRDLGVEP
jgi:hypothetical protein